MPKGTDGATGRQILTFQPADMASAEWSRLVIGCRPGEYSASRVARAVEDCDAQLLYLNVAVPDLLTRNDEGGFDDFPLHVEICVSHRNTDSVARSLERYGFTVLDSSGSDTPDDDRAMDNYRNLMRYIDI